LSLQVEDFLEIFTEFFSGVVVSFLIGIDPRVDFNTEVVSGNIKQRIFMVRVALAFTFVIFTVFDFGVTKTDINCILITPRAQIRVFHNN
jgi:hypothetical protein